ncbi:hypothetical protein P152DRAFT_446778 [Eremomyces bilateralis CBS 781.70]|uniref:ADF-H domain-containing protein n=1 Tax=Eremomyces bilateralis CBS 781.70 TaxID=1392243 RepID=A0A6G1GD09_9PEZI|nr:uncharacterized protein P152DRAFT_446778 [Eremomyces bilateralis CBS 781.70]KAF1815749.1 hypothetical protein P152DRAFT_446778 [Eremomyces bilateralis CBS 781.70]
MSLNGLGIPAIAEAHQAALAEAGGWFLLKYTSRDSVDILTRGNGGAVEAKSAIASYTEVSPLFGFLLYRRRKVLIKYIPEGTSRLMQARVAVHFNEFSDKFSPHDTTISITTANGLSESGLASACSLHTATASNTSSSGSLQRKRLDEITEDAEESGELKVIGPQIFITEHSPTRDGNEQRAHTPSSRPWTPRSSSLARVDVASLDASGDSPTETKESNDPGTSVPDKKQDEDPKAEETPKAWKMDSSEVPPALVQVPPLSSEEAQPAEPSESARPQTGKSDHAPSFMSAHTQSSFAPTLSMRNEGDVRTSTSTARPSLSDISFASLYNMAKPKVKLGPRPTTDRGRAPNSEGKRVANLPAGLRAATRRAVPHHDSDETYSRPYSRGQESVYSTKSAKSSRFALQRDNEPELPPLPSSPGINRSFKASNRTSTSTIRPETQQSSHAPSTRAYYHFPHAPPPIPDIPPRSPARPTSATSAKSMPISLGTGNRMTPEKQRLMRAVELRKRQQEQRKARQEREEEEKQVVEREVEEPPETKVEGTSAKDKAPQIELDVSAGAIDGDEDEEDEDGTPKASSPQVENGQLQVKVISEGSKSDSGVGVEVPVNPGCLDQAAPETVAPPEELAITEESAEPATSEENAQPAIESSSPTSVQESKSSDQGEVESTRPSSVEDASQIFGEQTSKEPSIETVVEVKVNDAVSEEPSTPEDIGVEVSPPRNSTLDTRDPEADEPADDNANSTTQIQPTEPEEHNPTVQRNTSMRDRRKGGVHEPLRVDVVAATTDHSDVDAAETDADGDYLSDDDSFMEELQTAQVQEAKPMSMSVSKSPITPFFTRRPSNGSLLSVVTAAARQDGSGSATPTLKGWTTPVRSYERKASLTTPDVTHAVQQRDRADSSPRPASSIMSVKKVHVSSGISQRIKALTEKSNRDSVATITPEKSPPEDRMSRSSFATRKSSIRSLGWGNREKDKDQKESNHKQRPSRTIQMAFGDAPDASRHSTHSKRLSRASLSSMAPSEPPYPYNPSNTILSPTITSTRDSTTPHPQAVYSISHPAPHNPPKRPRDSVSVTARIIRPAPDGAWGPDLAVPGPGDAKPLLQQSPLIIEHHRTEPPNGRVSESYSNRTSLVYGSVAAAAANGVASPGNLPSGPYRDNSTNQSGHSHHASAAMSRSSMDSGAGAPSAKESTWNLRAKMSRRMSEARSGPTSPVVPVASSSASVRHRSMSSVSVDSLALAAGPATDDDGMSMTGSVGGKEGKRGGGRTSRLFKRMSSGISAGARKMSVMSPTTVREEGEEVAEVVVERRRPEGCEVGDLNVQFPDTLLWKRRYLHISPSGDLVIKLAKADPPSTAAAAKPHHAATKRFHLTEFRPPYVPDQDAQELPNSVVLDFVDGRTLQVACQDAAGQRRVLGLLKGRREEWVGFGRG